MKLLVTGASCLAILCTGPMATRVAAQAAGGGVVGWQSDSLRPSDDWNTFNADLRVKRTHTSKNGTTLGAMVPDALYHLERSNRSGAWKTVLTVLSIDRTSRLAFNGALKSPGPLPVQRLENDEDGTPIRAYNAQGIRLRSYKAGAVAGSPTTSLPPRTTGTGWIDAFVATPANRTTRQQAFERRYGLPTSMSGSRWLYAKQDAARTQQLYVDPATMVTLEAIDVQNGVRVVRSTFRYGAAGSSGLVRLGVRSEVLVSPTADDVTIVDSSYSNIRLDRR